MVPRYARDLFKFQFVCFVSYFSAAGITYRKKGFNFTPNCVNGEIKAIEIGLSNVKITETGLIDLIVFVTVDKLEDSAVLKLPYISSNNTLLDRL